ncbi:MAG: inositol monophosphatase family protein, partial [Novosphingobium sp.]
MIADALTRAVYPVIIDAVERAIMPRYQTLTAGQIEDKGGNDLVTIADREAELILAEGLSRILPEATIVGEEAASANPALLERLGDDLCWIIDPVDGTNNFANGKGPFGVLVALSERGETKAGWLYDPLSGRFCHAVKDGGAFIMGDPVRASPSGRQRPVAAISLVFMDPAKREAMRRHIAPHYELVDIPRCAAEQYPRIACGINDVSIFERTLAWDHAAGVLFVNEAGGKVARADGRPYRVDEAHLPGLIGAASPA